MYIVYQFKTGKRGLAAAAVWSALMIGLNHARSAGDDEVGRRVAAPVKDALVSAVPISRPKLAELVQNRLLAVIQAENLKPGDPLPSERELMQSYAVGRPSIREAMQNLKRMGLIEINHGERPRVAAPSFE